jgi:hypothetical protein
MALCSCFQLSEAFTIASSALTVFTWNLCTQSGGKSPSGTNFCNICCKPRNLSKTSFLHKQTSHNNTPSATSIYILLYHPSFTIPPLPIPSLWTNGVCPYPSPTCSSDRIIGWSQYLSHGTWPRLPLIHGSQSPTPIRRRRLISHDRICVSVYFQIRIT